MKFSIIELTPEQVQQRLLKEPGIKLLDVREPFEYYFAHLPNSILLNKELANEILQTWAKDTPIICYCHHGVRSHQAAWALAQQGFTNVANMLGGIEAWSLQVDETVPRY